MADKLMESDKVGGIFVNIDNEVDKIIASLLKIDDYLDDRSIQTESTTRKLKDILDKGINPYVAEFADILNKMEEA